MSPIDGACVQKVPADEEECQTAVAALSAQEDSCGSVGSVGSGSSVGSDDEGAGGGGSCGEGGQGGGGAAGGEQEHGQECSSAIPADPPPLPPPLLPPAPTGAPLQPRLVPPALHPAAGAAEISVVDAAVAVGTPEAASRALQAAAVLDKLLALARQIRTPRVYVGYSAFILFALRFGVRPFMWEGANRIDIVHTFAPWQDERCQEACSVDGVCCCLMPAVAGAARLVPVSEDAPLNQCQHFVAAALMDAMEAEGSGIVPFYSRLGAAVLGTVMDGDCGIDTMCMMLRRPQTIDARKEIRQELHDYLMERVREPWMQDIMQACQEISAEDLEAYRSCGEASRGHAWAACAIVPVEAGESQSQNKGGKVTEELLEALAWSTGVKDTGLLVSVAADLSDVLRDEQLRKHALAKLEGERQTPAEAKQVLVFPNLLRSRMQVAKLYHDHLRSCGWQEGEKEPWGARTEFMGRLKWGARGRMRWKTQSLGRWLRTFLAKDVVGGAPIRRATPRSKMWSQRQRGEGGGRSTKCEWLRQELFEWWSGVRYAVDWSSIKKNTAPEVVPKKLRDSRSTLSKRRRKSCCPGMCGRKWKVELKSRQSSCGRDGLLSGDTSAGCHCGSRIGDTKFRVP